MPVASLAIPVVPARTMRSPIAGIGTGLLAHREIIEVTGSGHQLSVLRCRWAVRIAATRHTLRISAENASNLRLAGGASGFELSVPISKLADDSL
jgi:hypothetical protein